MKTPERKDQCLLDDIQASRCNGQLNIWWLGQSGFLIEWEGVYLLADPYLSDSLTRKYEATEKPHVRMTELVIDPNKLDFIDCVSSSHNHTDHLDGETLSALLEVNTDLVLLVPEANQLFAADRLGLSPARLTTINTGETLAHDRFSVHAVPAAHEELTTDDLGRLIYLGYIFQIGPWTIYHSGDTVRYDGMVDRLRPYNIDIAMLPINGSLPARHVPGNLWGREAAALAREANIKRVIPCHYDMFEFNSVTPDEFEDECRRWGQNFVTLNNGGRLSLWPE